MRLGGDRSLWHQNDLGPLWIDIQGSQNQDQSAECGEALDGLQPVVVQIEEQHLRLSRFEDSVSELFNFEN